jgi:Leucine-rich repeat (LRR) protein
MFSNLPKIVTHLTNLKELKISDNNIEFLPDLSNMTSLKILDIRNNNFHSLEDITILPTLKAIYLKGNFIPKEQVVKLLQQNPELEIQF